MSTYQEYLKNKSGEIFSPITSSDSVYMKTAGGGYQSLTDKTKDYICGYVNNFVFANPLWWRCLYFKEFSGLVSIQSHINIIGFDSLLLNIGTITSSSTGYTKPTLEMIGSHFYYNVRVFSKARLVSKDSGVYLDLYFPNNGTNVQTGKGSGYIIPFVTQRSLLKNFSLCNKPGLDTDTALVEINL